ncbi:hypothetical protein AB0F91_00010 [Amycolatopsis sp. NPDC023774]|uniref:non-homologous end-joining DNA ligase LigD n=1 Tax=Amycolatopsis sp. NPDC023774 TaxID=3155015 RepID=UPI0033E8B242
MTGGCRHCARRSTAPGTPGQPRRLKTPRKRRDSPSGSRCRQWRNRGTAGTCSPRPRDSRRRRRWVAKDLRANKVFIDWSQNHVAKTTIAAYSLHGRDTPTASTPITWEEVRAWRTPAEFSRRRAAPRRGARRPAGRAGRHPRGVARPLIRRGRAPLGAIPEHPNPRMSGR